VSACFAGRRFRCLFGADSDAPSRNPNIRAEFDLAVRIWYHNWTFNL
jgi:hypothetical protein